MKTKCTSCAEACNTEKICFDSGLGLTTMQKHEISGIQIDWRERGSAELSWLYYQTHLSPQACHLAPTTGGAIAAVSSSPLHIYSPNTSYWVQFILPRALLSVLLSDSSIMCVRAWVGTCGHVHAHIFRSVLISSGCIRAHSPFVHVGVSTEQGYLHIRLPRVPWEPGVCQRQPWLGSQGLRVCEALSRQTKWLSAPLIHTSVTLASQSILIIHLWWRSEPATRTLYLIILVG